MYFPTHHFVSSDDPLSQNRRFYQDPFPIITIKCYDSTVLILFLDSVNIDLRSNLYYRNWLAHQHRQDQGNAPVWKLIVNLSRRNYFTEINGRASSNLSFPFDRHAQQEWSTRSQNVYLYTPILLLRMSFIRSFQIRYIISFILSSQWLVSVGSLLRRSAITKQFFPWARPPGALLLLRYFEAL